MANKEDDEFSSSVLLVAVAVYVAITAALFAGIMVTKPDTGAAIAASAKDYGAIIAGIPVLVAVWVAKQQMDANRRQHIATVKRTLRREIDALNRLEKLASSIMDIEDADLELRLGKGGFLGFWINRPTKAQIEKWKEFLPSEVTSYAEETWIQCGELMEQTRGKSADLGAVQKQLSATKIYAAMLQKNVRVYYDDISQYWS